MCVCQGPLSVAATGSEAKGQHPAESLAVGDVRGNFLAAVLQESGIREWCMEMVHSLPNLEGNREVIISYYLRT